VELKSAIALWMGEHIPTTQKSYNYPMKLFLQHMGGSRTTTSITPVDITRYFQEAIAPRKYAAATHNKHVKTLRTFFNWCVHQEIIPKTPIKVKMKREQGGISRDKAMTDQELAAIIDYVKRKPRDYALIMFLADSGCRRGGAASLCVGDIDWVRNRAAVTEKGDITRQVSFGEDCAIALRRWLRVRPIKNRITGVYVFSHDGEPIKAETISQLIRRVCKQIGIRVVSSHSLRHRKGHAFADAKIAPTYAATFLGNSAETVIRHYYPRDYDTAEELAKEFVTDPLKLSVENPQIINLDDYRKRG